MKTAREFHDMLLATIQDIRASGEVIDGERKLEDHPRQKLESMDVADILKDLFGGRNPFDPSGGGFNL